MLVWMDLEMTGLDPAKDVIVEIATLVTDDDLQIVAEGPDLVVAPGFIDLHTHLREPGQEYKETIASGAAAASSSGD